MAVEEKRGRGGKRVRFGSRWWEGENERLTEQWERGEKEVVGTEDPGRA